MRARKLTASSHKPATAKEAASRQLFTTYRAFPVLAAILLTLLTALAYLPVLSFNFIRFDDPLYFSGNPRVLRGLTTDGLAWAFHTRDVANWHPLTWLSLMMDVSLFGQGPFGPHLTNFLLHIANTLLLFAALRQLTNAPGRSAFAAGLFALHPLHIESVAWVSERKDVLCAFFGFLALWAYARYAAAEPNRNRPDSRRLLFYLLSLLLFELGLLSKPMLVTFPFLLLLLDFWPLQRFPPFSGRQLLPLLIEKVPFLLLTLISCVLTLRAQNEGGAVQPLSNLPMSERLANVPVEYFSYLAKTFWPAQLSIIYPIQRPGPAMWLMLPASFAVVGLCSFALWSMRRFPFFFVGWFWFLGTLVPVIGLVQVGSQFIADRYTYIPLIGIFIIVSWGAFMLLSRWRMPVGAGRIAVVFVLASLVLVTRWQLTFWRDGETLFRRALEVVPDNAIAYATLGQYSYEGGQPDRAIEDYRHALALEPNDSDTHDNLGVVLAEQGQADEAIAEYNAALRLNPSNAEAHNNLANVLHHKGRTDEAIPHFREALRLDPDFPEAHNNLGNALAGRGELTEAVSHYRAALDLNPNLAEAHCNLGLALVRLGRRDEAVTEFNATLRLKPDFAIALRALQKLVPSSGNGSSPPARP